MNTLALCVATMLCHPSVSVRMRCCLGTACSVHSEQEARVLYVLTPIACLLCLPHPPPHPHHTPAVSKNHLELRSNSPQWVYSTAPLVKPDGTPVDHPQAGAAGYAMLLNDRQVCVLWSCGALGTESGSRVWVQAGV